MRFDWRLDVDVCQKDEKFEVPPDEVNEKAVNDDARRIEQWLSDSDSVDEDTAWTSLAGLVVALHLSII